MSRQDMCGWSTTAITHPSARGQSRLGPRTMAMLLGVILFTVWCSDSRERNWIRYLTDRKQKDAQNRDKGILMIAAFHLVEALLVFMVVHCKCFHFMELSHCYC